jgi:hypothetical protein
MAVPLSRWMVQTTLTAGAVGCVETTVPYPANFPPFKIDEVASEVELTAMVSGADAPATRTALRKVLEKWESAGHPSGVARQARFRAVVDDYTPPLSYVTTVLVPTLMLAQFGVPSGSATCVVDFTFDNGEVTYTAHKTMGYAFGAWYDRWPQHDRCVEKLAKLTIIEAATQPRKAR